MPSSWSWRHASRKVKLGEWAMYVYISSRSSRGRVKRVVGMVGDGGTMVESF